MATKKRAAPAAKKPSTKKPAASKASSGNAKKKIAPLEALKRFALTYPETHEDMPWGHVAIKVRTKAFLFMSLEPPSLSVKLPNSAEGALTLPFTEPTGYGLGKSGWVTARFGPKDAIPLELLRAWVDESFRAVAPKKLSRDLPPP